MNRTMIALLAMFVPALLGAGGSSPDLPHGFFAMFDGSGKIAFSEFEVGASGIYRICISADKAPSRGKLKKSFVFVNGTKTKLASKKFRDGTAEACRTDFVLFAGDEIRATTKNSHGGEGLAFLTLVRIAPLPNALFFPESLTRPAGTPSKCTVVEFPNLVYVDVLIRDSSTYAIAPVPGGGGVGFDDWFTGPGTFTMGFAPSSTTDGTAGIGLQRYEGSRLVPVGDLVDSILGCWILEDPGPGR